jgi:FtsP/CotA-like multicopper oxidase with cupredoxin domain
MTDPTPHIDALAQTAARLDRRRFLRKAGIVGAALPVAAGAIASACYEDPTGQKAQPATGGVAPGNVQPGPTPASGGTSASQERWRKIDADHKQGVVDFLRNQKAPLTKGRGNVPLEPRIENGVKVWDITVDEVDWEVAPGQVEKARGYNGMIPGPILRGKVGDRVRINVKNNLTESTAVHWHGIHVPYTMDGVPFVTQDPIEPGQTFTYEFTLKNAGSHMYHSHHDSADQVNRGLLGAFIIDPADPKDFVQYDREYVLILNDSLLGYTLNGKGFPATDALVAKKGERILVRWMNEGMMYHPMHLHGLAMEVVAIDGYKLANPWKCDTIDVPPGNRFDTIIEAFEPGLWAFHCHVLSHAESAAGFFGLVTVLVVEDENFKVADILNSVAVPVTEPSQDLRVSLSTNRQAVPDTEKGVFTLWCEQNA